MKLNVDPALVIVWVAIATYLPLSLWSFDVVIHNPLQYGTAVVLILIAPLQVLMLLTLYRLGRRIFPCRTS
jgi:hypothetical protein